MVSAIRSGAVRSGLARKDRDRPESPNSTSEVVDHYARQACARVTARKELRDALGESMFEMTIQGSSSELFMKTVILAEDKPEAGLTQDARFPMMKNYRNRSPRRHRDTEKPKVKDSVLALLRGSVPPW